MANTTQAANVTINGHVARRVSKNQVDTFISKKRLVRAFVAGVSAEDSMTPGSPNIAAAGDGCVRDNRNFILGAIERFVRITLRRFFQDDLDLAQGKTGRLDFEAKVDETLEFNSEDLPIPAGVEC